MPHVQLILPLPGCLPPLASQVQVEQYHRARARLKSR